MRVIVVANDVEGNFLGRGGGEGGSSHMQGCFSARRSKFRICRWLTVVRTASAS